MAKKSKAIEVLKPIHPVPNVRAQLDAYIEQKMAEIMGAKTDGIFEPFFQSKAIENEIRKRQTVPQQRKWHYYFEEWGCLVCESKDRMHKSLGMCTTCFGRIKQRLAASLRRAEAERPEPEPVRDLQDVARKALRAARKALPAKEWKPKGAPPRD
jgi:hypothetical protein